MPSPNLTSKLELYINSRVIENKEKYEADLLNDQSHIATIDQSNKRYVIISSSSSPVEKALIISAQAQYLRQNNNYYIINHHGAHWDSSIIFNGNSPENINSSGADLACGCYTILQIIAHDPNILDQSKISARTGLKNALFDIDKGLEKAKDKEKYINGLMPEVVRNFVAQAILNSNDPQKKEKAANVLKSKYELSNDDIAAALNGLGINYIERSQLHNIAHGFDTADIETRKNRIRNIFKKKVGDTIEKREKLYDEEISEFSVFLNKTGSSDMEIGNFLKEIDDELQEEIEEKKEEEKKEIEINEEEKKEEKATPSLHHPYPNFTPKLQDDELISASITNYDYNFESKKQDIRLIRKALECLEYLLNPSYDPSSYDPYEHFAILVRNKLTIDEKIARNDEKIARKAQLFSTYISKLSVMQGSIVDKNDNKISWELLRKIEEIVKTRADTDLLKNDLDEIRKNLEEILKKELPKDFEENKIEISKELEIIFQHLKAKVANQNSSEEIKEEVQNRYENILFEGINRNQFNNYIILPEVEKGLYTKYLKENQEKIAKLVENIDQLQHSEKNSQALLAIAALIGEIAKNILIFERYIPEPYRKILKDVKKLRDAIEHMVDYQDSGQYLFQKNNDSKFFKNLVKFIQEVSQTFKDLPSTPQRQIPLANSATIKKADDAILAIRQSLPKLFVPNQIFEDKLKFIREVMIGSFEYQNSESNINKIFGNNVVKLLQDGCPELQCWKGVKDGIAYNLEIEAQKVKKKYEPEVKKEINELFQELIKKGFKVVEAEKLSYDEKYKILEGQYGEEKRYGIKKRFSNLREKRNNVKKEAGEINAEIKNDNNRKLINDYNRIKRIDPEVEIKGSNLAINEFIEEYQKGKNQDENFKKHVKDAKDPTPTIKQQFEIIINSLANITKLTNDLIKENSTPGTSHRKAANEDKLYHQAVLFNLTVIGQVIQNLNHRKEFVNLASLNLKKESSILRKIRNSIAHDQDVKISGTPSYYGNDLMANQQIRLSGSRAYDLIEYFKSIQPIIKELAKKIEETKTENFDGKKEQESLYQKYLMKEELLQKAVNEKDSYSCLDILCKINYLIKDERRFVLRARRHLNEIYYRNILLNDLKILLNNKEKIDAKNLEFCESFLEKSGIKTGKRSDHFKLAKAENFKKCKNILEKLKLDLKECKNEKDYFILAKQELNKVPSKKDPLQIEIENAVAGNSNNECEKLLRKLKLETDEQYHWLDYSLENVKSELYSQNAKKNQRIIYLPGKGLESVEYPDEINSNGSFVNFFKDFHELPREKQISLIIENKKSRAILLKSAKDEAKKYLEQKSNLTIADLYYQKQEIENICKNNNITIEGVSVGIGDNPKYKGKENVFFIKSETNNPNEIARFKRELCNLFGVKIKIITSDDLAQYLESENRAAHFNTISQNLQQIKLSILQNSYELYEAVKNQNIEAVKQILETKKNDLIIDINININGYTPLDSACMKYSRASFDIAKLLLEAGADPKLPDKHGNNMLHNAAQDGEIELANLAIEYGVSIESKNLNGETVLDMALDADNSEEFYKLFFPLIKLPTPKKLVLAIQFGDVENVKNLLPQVDANQEIEGNFLLNIACDNSFGYERKNKQKIVKLILDAVANIDAINKENENALNSLLSETDEETYDIAKLLIDKVITINQNALDRSIYHKDTRIMELILCRNSNFNITSFNITSTAAKLLNLRPNSFKRLDGVEKLELLISCGVDPNYEDEFGKTLLEKAQELGDQTAINLLKNIELKSEEKSASKDEVKSQINSRSPSSSPRNNSTVQATQQNFAINSL